LHSENSYVEIKKQNEGEDGMERSLTDKQIAKFKSMPLKVTLLYTLFGSVWIIFFSELALRDFVSDAGTRTKAEIATGCFYLLVTAGLFFVLLSKGVDRFVKATAAQKESESRLQAIFDSAVHGIFTINENGTVESMNRAAVTLFGYSKAEVVGQNVRMLMPEPDRSRHNGYISHYIGTGEKKIIGIGREVVGLRKGGATFPLHLSISEVKLGDRRIFTGIMHDITRMKRAENALAEEKERLAVTLRSIGDGVITTDIAGKVAVVNKTAERLTGWRQQEAVGRRLGDILKMLDAKTRKPRKNPLDNVLASDKPCEMPAGTLLIARDGSERLIADSCAPIHDHESKLVGAVFIFRDVTEKQKLEEEIHKAEKAEAISILAAGIAHDFNNYLNIILSNLALAKMSGGDYAEINESLSETEKATGWARDVVQQLLEFSKGGVPVKKVVGIGEMIRDAASFALSGSKVICEFAIPDDLAPVEIDTGQITQVINNLIINADQAMPEGGRIHVRAGNETLGAGEIAGLPAGNYVKISIQDEGVGISPENMKKIFDPYFTTKETGTGLGLATSFTILKNHGGTIAVDSHAGKGTRFSLYLPATEDAIALREEKVEEKLTGKGRVLVMDDNDSLRTVTVKILGKLGYEAEPAVNGEEAVRKYQAAIAQSQPFDVVMLDLTIVGGMGGVETFKVLQKFDPGVKGIACSGYSLDPAMVNFRDYGLSGVAIKPYKVQELNALLQALIEREEVS
jgi:PAS domain S-box-containing protein